MHASDWTKVSCIFSAGLTYSQCAVDLALGLGKPRRKPRYLMTVVFRFPWFCRTKKHGRDRQRLFSLFVLVVIATPSWAADDDKKASIKVVKTSIEKGEMSVDVDIDWGEALPL